MSPNVSTTTFAGTHPYTRRIYGCAIRKYVVHEDYLGHCPNEVTQLAVDHVALLLDQAHQGYAGEFDRDHLLGLFQSVYNNYWYPL
jgi:hypothetical protein